MTHLSKMRASIDNFFQLSYNSVLTPKIPHPWINVVYSWRKTRGFKCNIGLGGGGGDTQGEGTDVKRGLFFFYGSASTLLSPFGPSFEVAGEKNADIFQQMNIHRNGKTILFSYWWELRTKSTAQLLQNLKDSVLFSWLGVNMLNNMLTLYG